MLTNLLPLCETSLLGLFVSMLISFGIFSSAFRAKREDNDDRAVSLYKIVAELLLLLCLSAQTFTVLYLANGGWNPRSDDLLRSIFISMMLVFELLFWVCLAKGFLDRKRLLQKVDFTKEPHHIFYSLEEIYLVWSAPTMLVLIVAIFAFSETSKILSPWAFQFASYLLMFLLLMCSRSWGDASCEREKEHR